MATVGVVIPCYRYGHLLPESVGSALDQPGVDVRVLIIDDASGDGSADRARELSAADNRIEVIEHRTNSGHIATFNEGLLDWCDTDYVALLSADDMLAPGALTRAARLLDANPGVGFAYGRVLTFTDAATRPTARTEDRGWRIYDGANWLARRFRDGNGCITSPEVVVRTKLQKQIGGYRPDLPHTADIEMWMRFAAYAEVGYLRGVDQAFYRVHGMNMSGSYRADGGVADLEQRRAAYLALLDECGSRIAGADRLERTIRRRLARDALYRANRAIDGGRTSSVPVDALVAFAEETTPDAHQLPGYSALRLRRLIGEQWAARLQLSTPSATLRRGRAWLWWQSWNRRGI